jgi:hypothetical protein
MDAPGCYNWSRQGSWRVLVWVADEQHVMRDVPGAGLYGALPFLAYRVFFRPKIICGVELQKGTSAEWLAAVAIFWVCRAAFVMQWTA